MNTTNPTSISYHFTAFPYPVQDLLAVLRHPGDTLPPKVRQRHERRYQAWKRVASPL